LVKRGRAKTSPDDRHGAVPPQYGQKTGQEDAVSATRSFEVVAAELNGAPGVAIRGEIDLDAVPSLESALDTAIRSTAGAFVLDLCDLDFLDSSGLRVMLRARARLAREDRELAIVCPPGPVRRLFEVVGIADLLFFYASREDAAAALVPAD
jgi:anti-anti-sigma factor